jgi:predicted RNA-binding protein Jag
MDKGRQSRRPGRYRPTAEGGVQRAEEDDRLREIIRDTELTLAEAIQPVQLPNLNAFERKQIHQYFERRKPAFETKTYRGEGDSQVLWVFPIANLTKFAEAKAQEALETGKDIVLPPMSSYERFIVHNVLKDMESVEAVSVGEGPERHIVIQSKQFGRGLKKIMKKIKLL